MFGHERKEKRERIPGFIIIPGNPSRDKRTALGGGIMNNASDKKCEHHFQILDPLFVSPETRISSRSCGQSISRLPALFPKFIPRA